MNAEEVQNYMYLAASRLSEIGYQRYMRFQAECMRTQSASKARELMRAFIDRQESREMALSIMVRCAPMRNPLQ